MQNIILMLFAHWVGDYGLQTNQMAAQKATNLKWLTLHVLAYTTAIAVAALLLFPFEKALYYALVNAALHWATDFVTGRFSNKYRANPRLYYPIIGFDQFIHATCLIETMGI